MLQTVRLLMEPSRTSEDHQGDQDASSNLAPQDEEVQFREIHKNGWLRLVMKKDMFLWFAFCIHDDTEPRLEGFFDKLDVREHRPIWAYSLRNVSYLSPTLCATQNDDYEFCINFNNDSVVRLAASTYQAMCDWVQVVTRKLTDMKILRPKENIYSKGPERITTRDPTSPLPPPPIVPRSSSDQSNPGSASSTSSLAASNANNSSPLTVFTFDETQIEERRLRLPESQAEERRPRLSETQVEERRTRLPEIQAEERRPRLQETPAVRPPAVVTRITPPVNNEENSSYENIFLASSSSSSSVLTEEVARININEREQNLSSQSNGSNERYVALRDYRSSAGIPDPPPTRNNANSRRLLTLREQQVEQLNKEISHPAGVRLQLGRRDCKHGIAFVESFGGIWVAGWKQRDHPLLYNVLHIGDLVLSVAGIVPSGVSAIKNILSRYTSPRVDIIVRRLPHAQVLILKKTSDSEGFGIDVVENEIIGVSEDAQTAGLTLFTSPVHQTGPDATRVTWSITELNGRPINIFDGNVREKLGAVGCDVSLVVQPTDLITILRKKLRSIRGYKAFVL